ncbi:MAG: hypothetical protein AAGF93_24635 [Cyanobacteria bacterium P01_H01_bin.105]
MKFQRTVSQPYILLHDDQLSSTRSAEVSGVWQRFVHALSLDDFWTFLVKFATGSSEPVVRKRCDRTGNISYTIYDPMSQQQSGWLSEADARMWLEQRYHR